MAYDDPKAPLSSSDVLIPLLWRGHLPQLFKMQLKHGHLLSHLPDLLLPVVDLCYTHHLSVVVLKADVAHFRFKGNQRLLFMLALLRGRAGLVAWYRAFFNLRFGQKRVVALKAFVVGLEVQVINEVARRQFRLRQQTHLAAEVVLMLAVSVLRPSILDILNPVLDISLKLIESF